MGNCLTCIRPAQEEESPSQPQPTSQEEHQTSDDEDSSSDGTSARGTDEPPTKDQWQHIMKQWPKRPTTNYLFFVKEHFGQIWKANPGSKFGFVSRQVANQWAQASEVEKERYTQLFFQDRERYRREVEALWQSLTQDHAKVAGPTESPSQPQPTSQEEHQTSDDEDSSSDGSSSEDSSSDEDNKS